MTEQCGNLPTRQNKERLKMYVPILENPLNEVLSEIITSYKGGGWANKTNDDVDVTLKKCDIEISIQTLM
jgi:hypothetical protein